MGLLKVILSYLVVLGPPLFQFLGAWRAAGFPLDAPTLLHLLMIVLSGGGALTLHSTITTKARLKYNLPSE